MVRGDISVLPHAVDYQVLVNGESERLADVDIVERLGQVIHGVVVDPQLRYRLVLVVRQRLGRCEVGGRNSLEHSRSGRPDTPGNSWPCLCRMGKSASTTAAGDRSS